MIRCMLRKSKFEINHRETTFIQCQNHIEYEEFCYEDVFYQIAFESSICGVV